MIAFETLEPDDLSFVFDAYPSFEHKIREALRFTDMDSTHMTPALRASLDRSGWGAAPDEEHLHMVRRIHECLARGDTSQIEDLIIRAAHCRRFLG